MEKLKQIIDKELSFHQKLLKEMESAIKDAPEGILRYRINPGGSSVPYLTAHVNGKRVRKRIPSDETELITRLRDKTVAREAIPVLMRNVSALEQASKYMDLNLYELCRRLGPEFLPSAERFIPKGIILPGNPAFECLKERQNPFPMDRNSVLTKDGRFRSKSESIEWEMIGATGARVKYEVALAVGGRTIFPDFVVDRPWHGDIGIIEHHGLIDNPEYRARKFDDLKLLMDNGYYPGINLLIISESRKDGFDMEMARKMIEAFCLP